MTGSNNNQTLPAFTTPKIQFHQFSTPTNPNPNFDSSFNSSIYTMCMGTICQTCSKANRMFCNGCGLELTVNTDKQAWFGCGSHLASVFANVPEDEWCICEPKVEKDGKKYPPQAK